MRGYDSAAIERYVDAVKTIFKDQELLGLDIINDGGLRYDVNSSVADWWVHGLCRIGGLKRWTKKPEGGPAIKSLISATCWKEVASHYPYSHATPTEPYNWPFWYTVEDEISYGKLDGLVEFYNITKPFTSKLVKFSIADAVLGAYAVIDKHYNDDRQVIFAMAKAFNRMLTDLTSNGCKIIQLDWPLAGLHHVANKQKVKPEIWRDMIEAFNEETKGVTSQIWLHFCFGRIGDSLDLNCAETFKHLGDCHADVIQIETANTHGRFLKEELTNWKEHCPEKDIGVGIVTPYNMNSERPEQVGELIREALQFVEPDRLVLTTDEGSYLSRSRTEEKLRTLIEAANMVRNSK